ncbi:MAG: translation initiation factor IF-2 [Parcubacteria group bacterium]
MFLQYKYDKVANIMPESRPPVVAVMGHIDHGKSTLLDYIRKTNTTERESGGITQHISAYEVRHKTKEGREGQITFLDTPGHEAFSNIRTRGAGAADIAVLVVSAEDGVKPQTLETLNQIKEGGVPYIVAINKIDKPNANVMKTKQDLAEANVYVEGFGGDVPVSEVSAKTGAGVDELLDTLLLMAELESFTAERDENGSGIIIESELDPKKGITATGIIKNGTVRKGLIAGTAGATTPLRFLLDVEGKQTDELSFSSPVQMVGWSEMPKAGAEFKTFLKKEEAEEYAKIAESGAGQRQSVKTLEEGVEALHLILKADTAGSLEALNGEIEKLGRERIQPVVISSGVGKVTEGDVKTALTAGGTIILSFNTKIDNQASALAERSDIRILSSKIIYELGDEIKKVLEEKEPRIEVEEMQARAKVLKLFSATKNKQVLGGRVLEGNLELGANVKILRREEEIGQGKVKELQQAKSATKSVSAETEFGALIESKTEIAGGDVLEAFVKVIK